MQTRTWRKVQKRSWRKVQKRRWRTVQKSVEKCKSVCLQSSRCQNRNLRKKKLQNDVVDGPEKCQKVQNIDAVFLKRRHSESSQQTWQFTSPRRSSANRKRCPPVLERPGNHFKPATTRPLAQALWTCSIIVSFACFVRSGNEG